MSENKEIERQDYSIEEAAELVGISTRMLYEYIAHGRIAYFQEGRQRRIPADELEEFIDTRRRRGTSQAKISGTKDGEQKNKQRD